MLDTGFYACANDIDDKNEQNANSIIKKSVCHGFVPRAVTQKQPSTKRFLVFDIITLHT